MERFKLWRRRRRLIRTYRGMRAIAEDHRADGHKTDFHAVNEAWLVLRCPSCPYYSQNFQYEDEPWVPKD
jgi:hypothetical protein